jgi:polysaccharide biosynthesis transport protein
LAVGFISRRDIKTVVDTHLQPVARWQEPEIGYGHLLKILGRRWLWFSGALIAGISAAGALTVLQSPTYQSSLQLLVEPNVRTKVQLSLPEGTQPPSFQEVELDYATQLNLMRSKQFIQQALAQVQSQFPEICSALETPDDCITDLQSKLSLQQVLEDKTDTRIFEAIFVHENPELTQQFLQALQKVYLGYNLVQQSQRVNQGLSTVNQQLQEVRKNLAESQKALETFRQGENLIDPEKQALALTESLNTLEQDQQGLQADYQDAQARYGVLQQSLELDPASALVAARLSQSTRYQSLLDELQKAELDLAQRLSVYTEADPIAQDLAAQRQRHVELLQVEVQRVFKTMPEQIQLEENQLLQAGQLGEIDLTLVNELVNTEVLLKSLQARQTSLAQTEKQLRSELNRYPNLIAQYDRLQPEVETQRDSLAKLLEMRQALSNDLAQGGFNWQVVEQPLLGEQIAPVAVKNLLLGAVAGVFVGALLAFGREALDTVVHTSDELKKQVALPLLGVLPEVPLVSGLLPAGWSFWRASAHSASTVSAIQWQPFREAVDVIYKNIQLSTASGSLKSLMVTAALANEGKTTFALGLALSAARVHQRVLMIDADLRKPSLHEQLGLANEVGLSTVLSSKAALQPITVTLQGTQVDVIPAGPIPVDPVRLLNSRKMRELISYCETKYDLIIVDTAALLGVVDALQVASLCHGTILVSRLDQVTQADLMQATQSLAKVNTLGIIANGYRGNLKHYGHSEETVGEESQGFNMAARQ